MYACVFFFINLTGISCIQFDSTRIVSGSWDKTIKVSHIIICVVIVFRHALYWEILPVTHCSTVFIDVVITTK